MQENGENKDEHYVLRQYETQRLTQVWEHDLVGEYIKAKEII